MSTRPPHGRPHDTRNGHVRVEHPVVTALRADRTADAQLRVADAIARFAGSVPFVYIHVVFIAWMDGGRREFAELHHRTGAD